VDHDELQKAVGVLVAASHEGTLSRHAARQDANHNAAANAADVAATVWSLLQGETPLTFIAPGRPS
jgi:hypothetical protein